MTDDTIETLRDDIDRADRDLLDRITHRAGLSRRIGRVKREAGLPVYDPAREKDVLDGLAGRNDGPLSDEAVRRIFTEIISACRTLQGPRVAFLGPEATFSHAAALARFGPSARCGAVASVSEIFQAVETRRADYGVVPAENSTEGAVGVTMDNLAASDLLICAEVCLTVSHVLVRRSDDFEGIRRVLSHPQALAQCRQWLARRLPGVEIVAAASTAAAAEIAASEPEAAAIGSEMLAERFGLNVLASGIQDRPVNQTRFLVIGHDRPHRTGRDKTSIYFALPHRPGALNRALEHFSKAGLNLTRIESRPSPSALWEYIFFLDFSGHIEDPAVEAAMTKLSSDVERYRWLGSYPIGTLDAKEPGPDGLEPRSGKKGN